MDRERVIKGLEIILNGCDEIKCEDCCFHIKEPAKPRRCGMIEEQIQEEALALLKEQNGLMLALEQSNAVNGYLNAEVERLNGLLKEQEAKRKNRLPYSPDSNVQWT